MVAYRQRLDTTTNWAITSSAVVTTFSMGNPLIPHEAFLFLMFVNLFFLVVEARRFQAYEAARYRVLLLEHYFYPEVMGVPVAREWRRALVESLQAPFSYPSVAILGALGWRLRRNTCGSTWRSWSRGSPSSRSASHRAKTGHRRGDWHIPGVWSGAGLRLLRRPDRHHRAGQTHLPDGQRGRAAVLSQEPD